METNTKPNRNRNRYGRNCACCTNPRRSEIDAGLIKGVPLRTLGKEFGISAAAIMRHRDLHMKIGDQSQKQLEDRRAPSELAGIKSQLPSREDVGGVLMAAVDKIQTLIDRNLAVNDSTALSGFAEVRKQLETVSRLAGHLVPAQHNTQINVGISVEGLGAELARQLTQSSALDTRTLIEGVVVDD